MIDFRYHVVSIVAVFLALGIGIIVGTTTLNGPILDDLQGRTNNLARSNSNLEQEIESLQQQNADEQTFAEAAQPYAVAGLLAGQSVTVVSTPGLSADIRKQAEAALRAAGASVAADVQLRDQYVDPAQDALLGSLAGRLAGPDVTLPEGTGAQRAAAQLASVLVHKPDATPATADDLAGTLAAYTDGQLLAVHGENPRPGTTALLLVGSAPAEPKTQAATDSAVVALARELDQASAGAVVALTTAAATGDGNVLDAITHDGGFSDHVSTVPSADLPSGRTAAVFALAGQLAGKAATFDTAAAAVKAFPGPTPSPGPSSSPSASASARP